MNPTVPAHPAPSRWRPIAFGLALALAACAIAVRRQTKKAEADFPPKGRFVTVHGVQLHWLEYGSADAAQTVVLLHGNGTMGEEYDISGLVDLAAARYRVIAFDRPGYGYSERPGDRTWGPRQQADLLMAALDQLGVRDPIVLGHSWGASVALAMGLRHPQKVSALVLASGYHTPSLRLDVTFQSLSALPVVGALLRHTVSPLIARLLWPLAVRRVFAPAPITDAWKARYPVWMSLRPSQLQASAAESAWMIPMTVSLLRHHRDMKVPTVVIAGADDRLLSTRWNSSRLNDRLPSSWLRVVEGTGHMVHHTATGQVMAALDQAAALAVAHTAAGQRIGAGAPSHRTDPQRAIDDRRRLEPLQQPAPSP